MDNKDIVSMLSTLCEISRDGEYGFRWCAEHAESTSVKMIFLTRAKDCALAAAELRGLLLALGGAAAPDESTTGTTHRGWVTLEHERSEPSDHNVLKDAQRGEEAALKRYRTFLHTDFLPPEVRSVLEIQFEGAQRDRNQIRELFLQARGVSH